MRKFYTAKSEKLEVELIENGIPFEHPNEDLQQFLVSDDDVDTVDKLARKIGIYIYIKDNYVTEDDVLGDRELELD